MVLPRNLQMISNTISACIAGIFLWSQVAWAAGGDLIANPKINTSGSSTPQQLQSRQSIAEAAINTKNAIENYETMGDMPTITYYASGKMESQTLTAPDANGNIYYHYKDENWNGQGYGRVDKSRRAVALDGEISHTYIYQTDSYGRLKQKDGYSDSNWVNKVSSSVYYNDANNRINTKTFTVPDSAGNIYYRYINENWNNQGYGRVDRTKRATTGTEGELSVTYSYANTASLILSSKSFYSDSNFTTRIRSYYYYTDSNNRLYYKYIPTPDSQGNTYYYYLNEDWNGQGYGRLYMTKRATPGAEGEMAVYYSYANTTSLILYYKSIYSDSARTKLIYIKYYYTDENNRLYYRYTPTPDAQGNTYYYYLNEDWNDQGYGRVSRTRRSAKGNNGELSVTYNYYDSTSLILSSKTLYSDSSSTRRIYTDYYFTDSNNQLSYANYYYNNSNNRLYYTYSLIPDDQGNTHYYYLNENWSGQGYGRVYKTKRLIVGSEGELSTACTYVSTTSLVLSTRSIYSDASWTNLISTTGYYNDANHRVYYKILGSPDSAGNIYYRYINEDWNSQGYGRVDRTKRATTGTEGELSVTYSYANTTSLILSSKSFYSGSNFTNRILSYYYYTDSNNRLRYVYTPTPDSQGNTYYYYLNENWNGQGYGRLYITKRATPGAEGEMAVYYSYQNTTSFLLKYKSVYSDSARTKVIYTSYYYNDSNNRLYYKVLATPDSQGNAYYYYLNEDWNGQGYGRISKTKRQTANSYNELAFTYTYYNDSTGRLQIKVSYSDDAYIYLVATYTYYNDSTNHTESKTLVTADSSGMIYYHYIDENWKGQGYGRIDISKAIVPLNGNLTYADAGDLIYVGELSYSYSYYDDADGRLMTKYAYSDADCTNLIAIYAYYNDSTNRLMSKVDIATGIIYTYYNDPSGRMESKTLPQPDSYGNIYYNYLNENWNGRGYGRIDRSLNNNSVNNELSYSYSYYNDTTGNLKTKNAYSDNNWSIPVNVSNYSNDQSGMVLSRTDTATGTVYSYYSSGYLESETLATPDASGNIYYHYIDEDWNGRGYGRIDKSVMGAPNDGELSYFYTYDDNGNPSTIKAYSDNNWTEPVANYFEDFDPNNLTNTYYASGRLESQTYVSTFSDSEYSWIDTFYSHYIDENWYGLGYGRLDKTLFLRSGSMYANDDIRYYYNDNTNCPVEMVEHLDSYDYVLGNQSTIFVTTTIITHGDPIRYPAGGFYYDVIGYDYIVLDQIFSDGSSRHWETNSPITTYDGPTSGFEDAPRDINLRGDLRQQISNLNASNENFPSSTDPQQQQVANLNKSPISADDLQIDLSAFRSFDDFIVAVQEKYSADPKLEELLGSVENLRNYLKLNNPLVNIDGDISFGLTLTSPPTPDGARIEISSFSGEYLVGDFNTPPWLGVFNGSDGYAQAGISVKNGTTVEASMTTKIGPMFNRTIISSDLFESRADFGSYTHGSGYTLDFTSSTFTGSRSDGFYFGASYDTLNSITQLKTSTETLVFVPTEVLSGERMPATVTENYGKLLYDIYNNGKGSLTPIEVDLIQTKTLEIVQDTLQNISGITQNDINAIAASQSTNIINIGQGLISYNPPN